MKRRIISIIIVLAMLAAMSLTAGAAAPGAATRAGARFVDVSGSAYYADAVAWAVESSVTNGIDSNHFGPDRSCTRGQVVTFLWRAAGMPEPTAWDNPFRDVSWDAFYCTAVLWAVSEGITNGKSATAFGPNDTCTRGQVVTFLYRAEAAAHRYDEAPPTPPANSKRIGVSLPTDMLQRWNQDGQNLKRILQSRGFTVELQFADNNVSQQIRQIESMVYNGARVLIIAPIDGEALGRVLEWAKRAGILVISYDRLITNTEAVDYYTTFDNWDVGVKQGEYIRDALNLDNAGDGSYNIEFVTGDYGDSNIDAFFDGAMSVLQPYLKSGALVCRSGQTTKRQAATEGWSTDAAERRFENILTNYYGTAPLHAVLASNDSTAQGVAYALESCYRNNVYPVITGQDCDIVSARNIIAGKQAMSVFKDTRDLVDATVQMADAIMRGARPSVNDTSTFYNGARIVPACLCAPRVCTSSNIRQLLIESGYYTWEDLYG